MNGLETEGISLHRKAGLWALALIAVGAATYANTLSGPFIFDDEKTILGNPDIRHVWPPWPTGDSETQHSAAGRPLIHLSLAINYAIGGLDTRGYHVVNIAVHILCALVLFGIVRRTLLSERLHLRFGHAASVIGLVCALLWMIHPLQTECVNYLIQRTESIMGLFYLLTLYCAIRADGSDSPLTWQGVAVFSCALGMASKEVMVTAPVMVLLYDWAFKVQPFRQIFRRRWGLYVGLAATWLILAVLVASGPRSKSVGFGLGVGAFDYALNQCSAIATYLRLALCPYPLVMDYGYPASLRVAEVAAQAILVVGLLGATAFAIVYRPMVGFLGAWFFVILAPTSSVIPITTEVAAERRMYLPLAGVIVLLAVGCHSLVEYTTTSIRARRQATSGLRTFGYERWIGVTLVTVLAITLGWTSLLRNRDYRCAVSIWRTAVEHRPDNRRAYFNLADLLNAEGKVDEAISHYREALRIKPDFAKAHNNLGLALQSQGKVDEAMEHWIEALRADPEHVGAHNNLGVALHSRGMADEAIKHYRRALLIEPDHIDAHNNLGIALQWQGRLDEAISHYRQILQIEPRHAQAHNNLGTVLQLQGKLDDAIAHFFRAVRFKPNYADAVFNLGDALAAAGQLDGALTHFLKAVRLRPSWPTPLVRVAWILATHPDPQQRDGEQAIRDVEEAIRVSRRVDANTLDTLAAAYASEGYFDRAISTAEQALTLAQGPRSRGDTAGILHRLELYRQAKPYIEPARALHDPTLARFGL
ncbi:MAG: tetratricopeptide repeat protein [Phycisphaerales bacterium]|nr:MAG: tetratricopeptide repeat protein [Phycisphaerales bacterium]